MKAKFASILPLTLLLLLTVAALTSCGHEHVASGWIMDPAATCTSTGHRYQRCTGCGEILREEDYNTSHSYDEQGFCFYCKRPQRDEHHLKYQLITVNGREGYAVAGIGNCNAIDLVIPEKHNSLPVLAITDSAFVQATRLETVTIPKTVQYVGQRAFYMCQVLKTVRFAANSACTEIGEFAFAECEKLRNAQIPSGVTAIPDGAFSGCIKLKNLTLHDGITKVGADAFGNCKELITTAEQGLVYLGTTTNPYLILYAVEDRTVTAALPNEGTRVIGPGALAGCASLTTLTLPEELASISAYALSGCASLPSLALPAGLATIGAYALQDCRALVEITLPAGITAIESGTFSGCTALERIALPQALDSVGSTAFYGCAALQFNAHGTGRYLGIAGNPYFLLCGYSSLPATDAPHADNRLIAENADNTLIP
ncbi:MAG: leucine-rich repeat domain-containing protein [Ruminococcaceae bacterium]|nr:leucine-rich repeat domain-containing protein [Oscillospiraceae bacterium]